MRYIDIVQKQLSLYSSLILATVEFSSDTISALYRDTMPLPDKPKKASGLYKILARIRKPLHKSLDSFRAF
jgi:hypothetical protein